MVSVEHPMRHSLLAADRPARAADLLLGLARGGRPPGAGRRRPRHLRVPPRAGRRGGLRRPAAGRAQRAPPRLAETLDSEPELLAGAPPSAVAALLACHWHAAHDVPQGARGLGAGGDGGQERVYAYSEAQRHLGARARAVGPRARRRRARRHGQASTCCATPRPPPRSPARPRARSRSCARRSRASTRRPTRCAPRSCSSASATTSAARARRGGVRGLRPAMALAARGRQRPARAAARVQVARADAARPLRRGRRARDGGAADGRRLRRARRPRPGAQHARLQPRRDGRGGAWASTCCGARATSSRRDRPHDGLRRRPSPTCRELLDVSGRTEEALAEVRACLGVLRRGPSARPTTRSWRSRASTTCSGSGATTSSSPACRPSGSATRSGTTPLYLHQMRGWIAVRLGDVAAARTAVAGAAPALVGHRRPAVGSPRHSLRPSWRCSRTGRRRRGPSWRADWPRSTTPRTAARP